MTTAVQNNALRQVKKHDAAKQAAAARLASGQQINRASEGAAELSASTTLRATVRGSSAALSNATRGVALGQVADGALAQQNELLLRMKELAVSAASDLLSSNDRTAADAEFTQLIEAIDSIATNTKYAGVSLLTSSATAIDIQVGEAILDKITIAAGAWKTDTTTLAINTGVDLTTKANAGTAQTTIDSAINTVSAARAAVGAIMVRLEAAINVNQVKIENLEASVAVYMEADLAKEATNLAMADIRSQMAQAMITKENQAAANITGLVR